MNERKAVHSGHRERLKDRLVNFPESLSDHELLEVLLFYSIPRKDTNVTAHEILSTFGGLKNAFSAKKSELTFVDGVGDNTATLFKLVNEIARRISATENGEKEYYGFNDYKKEVIEYFKDKRAKEGFLVAFFDKNHKLIAKIAFDCGLEHEVEVDMDKLNDAIVRYSPKFIILAHNHTSGDVTPSEKDRFATAKINFFANLHGARVLDHIIVSGEKAYSFFRENDLKLSYTDKEINDILDKIKEF